MAKRKGAVVRRESERSVEQTYKNRIRGMRCRTSWHVTTKSIFIRRLRAESSRTYVGRSAACPGFKTEKRAIVSDHAAELSRGYGLRAGG